MTEAEAHQVIQGCLLVLLFWGHDPAALLDDREYEAAELALILTYLAIGATLTATAPLDLPDDLPGGNWW